MKEVKAKIEIRTDSIFVKAEGDQEWLSHIVDKIVALKLKWEKVEHVETIMPGVEVSKKWLDV